MTAGTKGSRRAGPNEWMRRRFPSVFPTIHDNCFRFRRNGDATILSELKLAQCLGPLGSPEAPIHYCLEAHSFFGYSAREGIFEFLSEDQVARRVLELIEECILGIPPKYRDAVRGAEARRGGLPVAQLLKGSDIIPDPGAARDLRYIHVANGIVDLETLELLPFTPALPSSWKLPVAWDPDPTRPHRFSTMLERLFPDPDDRTLAVEVLASAFLGNPFQRFLLLAGAAGTGKSTLISLLSLFLGPGASAELKLEDLGGQFASYSWVGRLLLYVPELKQEDLHGRTIAVLKAISGHDPMTAELKHKNRRMAFAPRALPILVTNPKVRFNAGSNRAALRRRLVAFEVPTPSEPFEQEPFFAQRLVESEGAGILHLFLSTAHRLRRRGKLTDLTDLQECRNDLFLGQSEPLRIWAKAHVAWAPGASVLRDDAVRSAGQWLIRHGFQTPSTATGWSRRLKPLMKELRGVWTKSLGEYRNTKGWRHVTLD
jgi:hypothetical protein